MRKLLAAAGLICAWARLAAADDVLHPGTPMLDPPTLVALGVALPITGDDNFTATVAMRYRVAGTTAWHDALPLQHVHAEVVTGVTVSPQFAGSIFDLAPDTAYEIELHATDPDGSVDTTRMLAARTRPVPGDPAHPRPVAVSTAAALTAALAAAQPGDVITLANGTYAGAFAINASGTAADPIVIRGESEEGALLDGQGCTACNVIEIYGSDVHVEHLAIAHASRAIRFQGAGTQGNVVRRVHIFDVTLGIGAKPDQRDYDIADNVLEGRLVWPCVYTSDDPACNAGGQHGLHANDDGIQVMGDGHVVAHNTISGFGDAIKIEQDGARSFDVYGNDVLWTYDNGLELDGSARNTRALRNRFTNTFATLSFQPIFGGPAYALRNVLVNVADEQFKLHARGGTPTVGAVIEHNTIVRGVRALQCSSADAPLYVTAENNLFVGPAAIADLHVASWDLPAIATAKLDYNGWFPDGQFQFAYGAAGVTYPSFAAMVAGGTYETHSVLLDAAALADGLVGTPDWHTRLAPVTPHLALGSVAIDRAVPRANLDDGFRGAAPDLGAIEAGCAAPIYGVRPVGVDETTETFGCLTGGDPGSEGGGDAPGGASQASGCCGSTRGGAGVWAIAVVTVALLRRRRAANRR